MLSYPKDSVIRAAGPVSARSFAGADIHLRGAGGACGGAFGGCYECSDNPQDREDETHPEQDVTAARATWRSRSRSSTLRGRWPAESRARSCRHGPVESAPGLWLLPWAGCVCGGASAPAFSGSNGVRLCSLSPSLVCRDKDGRDRIRKLGDASGYFPCDDPGLVLELLETIREQAIEARDADPGSVGFRRLAAHAVGRGS